MPSSLRHVRLPNGLSIECAKQGRRGGPALLLHGITDTWRSFEALLPWLPGDWYVVSMTWRGPGGSSTIPSYRMRDCVGVTVALAESAGHDVL